MSDPIPDDYGYADAAARKRAPRRIYVAGPMSGLPDFNYPAFFNAAQQLAALGHDVVNPARQWDGDPHATWSDYMRRGITDVCTCDAMALLPGHQSSEGARLERHVAERLGLTVHPVGYWLGGPREVSE